MNLRELVVFKDKFFEGGEHCRKHQLLDPTGF